MKVTCGACSHSAQISNASDAWKCNCAAGVGPDGSCLCDATNEASGTESNPPDAATAEIQDLEARLVELRGATTPTGEVSQ